MNRDNFSNSMLNLGAEAYALLPAQAVLSLSTERSVLEDVLDLR
jgi:hypothetical protein